MVMERMFPTPRSRRPKTRFTTAMAFSCKSSMDCSTVPMVVWKVMRSLPARSRCSADQLRAPLDRGWVARALASSTGTQDDTEVASNQTHVWDLGEEEVV